MFTLDRIQIKDGRVLLFEFIQVQNTDVIERIVKSTNIWELLRDRLDYINSQKIGFLSSLRVDINIYIIFYEIVSNNSQYLMLFREETNPQKWRYWSTDFQELSDWFRGINGSRNDNTIRSKSLGIARTDNLDNYVCNIVKELYKLKEFTDDSGLELTKALLKGDKTTAVDGDLFQYYKGTNEFIIYEFLRRNSTHVTNITAHPMRYSWGNSIDNRRKFITLWNVTRLLGGKLYLINYSDDYTEKISILEVVELDETFGIRYENKYCMSYNVFLGWLKDMKEQLDLQNTYLRDFRVKTYSREYFDNWAKNRRNYGDDFYLD